MYYLTTYTRYVYYKNNSNSGYRLFFKWSNKKLILHVNFKMTLQVGYIYKRTFALNTLKGLLSTMKIIVCIQVLYPDAGVITVQTFIRFSTAMFNHVMLFQTIHLLVRSITLLTLVLFHLGVFLYVHLQQLYFNKLLVAEPTDKLFTTSVIFEMSRQVAFYRRRKIAFSTFVRFFSGMGQHMLLQLAVAA